MTGTPTEQPRQHPYMMLLIHGLRVKVSFSTEQNAEAPHLVREILKYGYLLRQSG